MAFLRSERLRWAGISKSGGAAAVHSLGDLVGPDGKTWMTPVIGTTVYARPRRTDKRASNYHYYRWDGSVWRIADTYTTESLTDYHYRRYVPRSQESPFGGAARGMRLDSLVTQAGQIYDKAPRVNTRIRARPRESLNAPDNYWTYRWTKHGCSS